MTKRGSTRALLGASPVQAMSHPPETRVNANTSHTGFASSQMILHRLREKAEPHSNTIGLLPTYLPRLAARPQLSPSRAQVLTARCHSDGQTGRWYLLYSGIGPMYGRPNGARCASLSPRTDYLMLYLQMETRSTSVDHGVLPRERGLSSVLVSAAWSFCMVRSADSCSKRTPCCVLQSCICTLGSLRDSTSSSQQHCRTGQLTAAGQTCLGSDAMFVYRPDMT
jgi:hypothetical protein